MRKTTPYMAAILFSIIATLLFFNAMSWYHFGDIPTKIVFARMIGFCGAIIVLSCTIVFFVMRKRARDGKVKFARGSRLTKKGKIILISVLAILALILLLLYFTFIGGFYASSDKVVGDYTGEAPIQELEQYEQWKIGGNKYGQPIFIDAKKAFDFFEDEFADVIDAAYDMYHVQHHLERLNKHNYHIYMSLIYQMPAETEEQHQRYGLVARFLDIYENSFKRWVFIPGIGWERI